MNTGYVDLETAIDEAERIAIIADSRDVHPARGKAIAKCESHWRRGGQCVCAAHDDRNEFGGGV